ncbi:MAG: transketolase, partial [Muribaculaceae bacterium]|nr:transketolase [Muribaculaceae bacterium]
YEMAMEEQHRPTGLILSRQDLQDLPAPEGSSRYEAAQGLRRGAYTVIKADRPEVVLVADGSEVSLLCEVAVLLQAEGIAASVVSAPSPGLFNDQPEAYRREVLPAGVPQFGLTAGLTITLRMIDGFNGRTYGMEHFGASAPYKVLDEKWGFTASNILSEIRRYLGK